MPDAYKIPKMQKVEYDALIRENIISRIAFCADNKPYIAPFLYVFDHKNLYFLSTRYGKKMTLFQNNPYVSVEIENAAPDMEHYKFVTLSGRLEEITDPVSRKKIKEQFAHLIISRRISKNALAALGYSPTDPPEKIVTEDRTMVWVLKDVTEIVALKESEK